MATQTGSIDLTASNSVKLAAEAGWQSDLEDYATKAELSVQADRIGMVVANNDASSSLQLTADAMTYIGNNVTIKGTDGTSTVISGGQIQAGSLSIGAFDSAAQSATFNSNISVGGRNLITGTAAMKAGTGTKATATFRASGGTCSNVTTTGLPEAGTTGAIRVTNTGSSATRVGFCQDRLNAGIVAGEPYMESCWVRGSTALSDAGYLQPVWNANGSSSSSNASNERFDLTTEWQYVSWYGTLSGTQQSSYSAGYVYVNNMPAGEWFEVCGLKVEHGNRATDWTPAPEDTPDQMTWYGTCSTAASTAEKAVACDGFELQTGARIAVKFTYINTVNVPTLNVNGTGAIATWYNNAVSSTTNPIRWGANATLNFIYDGSVWVLDERPPSYSATCSTAASTRSKAPSVVGALVVNGTRLSVRFSTANTYTSNSVQLNLASTGAYSVYQNNAVTSTTNTLLWDANTILTFVAQGTYWHLLSRSDASETATSYVTEITGQNGIMVHPSTDQTTGVQITSDVDILRGGTSVINIGTNDAVRVGSASGGHIAIDSDSMDFWASAAQLAMRFTGQIINYPKASVYLATIEDGVTRQNQSYNDNSYISLYTREEPTYEGSDEKVVTESMATMHAYARGAEGTAEISVFMHQDPDANTASRGAIIASDTLTCEGTTNVGDPYGSVDGLTIGSPTRVTSSKSCTALTNDTMGPYVALTAGKWLIMGNWGFTNTSSSAKRLTIGLYRNATGSAYTWRVHTTAPSSTAHKLEVVDTIVLTSDEVITLYASSSPASTSASTQWITAVRLS